MAKLTMGSNPVPATSRERDFFEGRESMWENLEDVRIYYAVLDHRVKVEGTVTDTPNHGKIKKILHLLERLRRLGRDVEVDGKGWKARQKGE